MFGKKKVCTFGVCGPFDIILYGYDYTESKTLLPDIMELLDVTVDVGEIEKTFLNTPSGQGDIWVYGDHTSNCLVFDLFRDPTDQMDTIEFGVVFSNKMYDRMYELFWAMYKEIDKKIKYSAYDINTTTWGQSVINGDDVLEYYKYRDKTLATQKIKYIK